MAVFDFISVAPAGNGGTNVISSGTIGAAGNSPLITPGPDAIIQIVCTAAFNIRFGTSTNITATSATALDILIPANTIYRVDIGHQNTSINLFSTAGGSYSVNYVVRN